MTTTPAPPTRTGLGLALRRVLGAAACLAVAAGAVVTSCSPHPHAPAAAASSAAASNGPASPAAAPSTPTSSSPTPTSSSPTNTPSPPAAPPRRQTTTSSSTSTSTRPRSRVSIAPRNPAPAPTRRTSATPTAAALGAVRAYASSDTAVDSEPVDTARRASAWLTPAFAAAVRGAQPAASSGAQWTLWRSHDAYLQVSVRISGDDHPADTATSAVRAVIVTAAPIGRDSWRGPLEQQLQLVRLQRIAAGWRACAITAAG